MEYHIEFDIEVIDSANGKQALEWIRFMIGDTGKMSFDNPLANEPFDPIFGTIKIERRPE